MDPIGALSYLAVGLEGVAGTPVKAQWQLDFLSETLRGQGQGPIRSRAINGGRVVKKVVQGGYGIAGDVSLEVTPDKWTKTLFSTLNSLVTTGSSATGTITSTGTSVAGTGTLFTTEFNVGDTLAVAGGQTRIISAIANATQLTVSVAFSPDVVAAAITRAPWTHVYKTAPTLAPMTFHVLRAQATPAYFVYPGCMPTRLSLRATIDAIVEAVVSLTSRGKEIVASPGTLTNINDAALALSTDLPFVFHQAAVSLTPAGAGGALAANSDTNNWQININTGVTTPKGLGAGRAPNRIHPGDSVIDGQFDMVFDSIYLHRRWMGVIDAAGADTPGASGILVGNSAPTFAARLLFTQQNTNPASSRIMQIDLPAIYLKRSDPEVKSRDGVIMQPVQWECIYDGSSATDITVTVTSMESNAQITQTGTNIATYA